MDQQNISKAFARGSDHLYEMLETILEIFCQGSVCRYVGLIHLVKDNLFERAEILLGYSMKALKDNSKLKGGERNLDKLLR